MCIVSDFFPRFTVPPWDLSSKPRLVASKILCVHKGGNLSHCHVQGQVSVMGESPILWADSPVDELKSYFCLFRNRFDPHRQMGWSEPRVPPNFDSLSVYHNLRIKIAIWTFLRVYATATFQSGRRATPLLCSKAIAAQQQLPASTCAAAGNDLFRIMGTLW